MLRARARRSPVCPPGRSRPSSLGITTLLAVTVTALLGCGGSSAKPPRDGSSGGTGGTDAAIEAAGGSGGIYTCPLSLDDAGCVGELYSGETIPLDIYVMFDMSGSMVRVDDGGTQQRIDEVRSAIRQFVHADASKDIGIGIGYFGTQPILVDGGPCRCTSCDPADYATPAVTIATLPGNAQPMMDSLDTVVPTGETPTGAAIRGACTYTQGWKRAHRSHQVVILLVTDGVPEAPVSAATCNPTLADAIAAAGECLLSSDAPIRTYVLGVGPNLNNLNDIAIGGGTQQAYLATSGSGAEVLQALNAIRADAAPPCEYQIPQPRPGQTIDYNKVNVVHTNSACQTNNLFRVDAVDACDPQAGGWHYDNPDTPTRILLCGKTCGDVGTPGSQVVISVGCQSIVPTVP